MRLNKMVCCAFFGLALVLSCALASANYQYTVAVTPATLVIGGTTVSLTGRSSTNLSGVNTVSLATLAINSITQPPNTDAINDPYSMTITITDPAVTGATGTFTVTGVLSGPANATQSNIDNTYTSVTPSARTIGPDVFSISVGTLGVPDFFYQPATVNGASGGLGGRITATPTAVPEPTSLALMGAAGLLLLRRRRGR
jgi:flagellar capping protein FliD